MLAFPPKNLHNEPVRVPSQVHVFSWDFLVCTTLVVFQNISQTSKTGDYQRYREGARNVAFASGLALARQLAIETTKDAVRSAKARVYDSVFGADPEDVASANQAVGAKRHQTPVRNRNSELRNLRTGISPGNTSTSYRRLKVASWPSVISARTRAMRRRKRYIATRRGV